MTSPETPSATRLQAAEVRLEQALARLEQSAQSNQSAHPAPHADADLNTDAILALRAENETLKGLLRQVSTQLDSTISQLKSQQSMTVEGQS